MQHCSVDTVSFICAEEMHWNTSSTDTKLICTPEMLATPVRIEFVDRWQAAWRNFLWNCLYVTQKWVKNQIGIQWKEDWIAGFIVASGFFCSWQNLWLLKWNNVPTLFFGDIYYFSLFTVWLHAFFFFFFFTEKLLNTWHTNIKVCIWQTKSILYSSTQKILKSWQ